MVSPPRPKTPGLHNYLRNYLRIITTPRTVIPAYHDYRRILGVINLPAMIPVQGLSGERLSYAMIPRVLAGVLAGVSTIAELVCGGTDYLFWDAKLSDDFAIFRKISLQKLVHFGVFGG